MAKIIKEAGGFVARNRGEIVDCYSNVSVYAGTKSAGFCGRNSGLIKRCYSAGKIKKYKDEPLYGFCAKQEGTVDDSFWVNKDAESDKFVDNASGVDQETFNREYKEKLEQWDTDNVWNISEEGSDIQVNLYKADSGFSDRKEVIEISDKDELLAAVEEINSGAPLENVTYKLTENINLGGIKWNPMGVDGNTSFNGCFDGAGHTIKNFTIEMKNGKYGGFFGYVGKKGEVHNLVIDCVISGKGEYSAPLCGWNEGTISDCVTRVMGHGTKYSGGFVGHNGGLIMRCSTYGKMRLPLLFPWWIPAAVMSVMIAAVPAAMLIHNHLGTSDEIFAPIIVDPNAKPFDEETIPEPNKKTDTSTAFIMNASMEVGTSNYAGAIGLKCPPWGTRGYVATATMSGSDLARNGASYTSNVQIYKSGLISPGYGVDVITLPKLPDGSSIPQGKYKVIVQFDFYDLKTNERSSVNTTAPIEVTVHSGK